jgi:hypothetical protein
MAKAARNEETTTEAPAMSAPIKAEKVAVTVPLVQTPVVDAPPMITFDRWFTAKKFKPHWKAGMTASVDTSGRKTMEQWDLIFKNY